MSVERFTAEPDPSTARRLVSPLLTFWTSTDATANGGTVLRLARDGRAAPSEARADGLEAKVLVLTRVLMCTDSAYSTRVCAQTGPHR